jgi:DNA-binding NarL/FixJ family response regulator
MLVDSHAILRRGLKNLLESAGGYKIVAEAADGRVALDLAMEIKPDVMVTEISLPSLNGINLAERVLDECPSIRILALSRYSSSGQVSQMLRAGARGYVLKDADPDELFSALGAVCQGQTFLSPNAATSLVEDYVSGGDGNGRSGLSPREREVLQLMAEGLSTKQIARKLFVSVKTVETHRRHIMQKLEIHSVAGLTKYAIREGLTTVEV